MNHSGFKVLLEGATGTGKTYSLRTLIDAGITPFIIATEPGIEANLGDIDPSLCHWHYIAPALPSFEKMLESAKKINTMSFEALTKTTYDKKAYGQFMEVLTTCANFVCDRTGESFGCVDNWGTDRALVIDSLSGLNIMAMDLAVGAKPVKSPGDWGVAMDNLERLITRWCAGINCHFILTAHMEREKNEITGAITLHTSTLGQKLGPKIPRFFDDVLQAQYDGKDFVWRSSAPNAELKARYLPLGEKLSPNFGTVLTAWKKMGGEIIPTTELDS